MSWWDTLQSGSCCVLCIRFWERFYRRDFPFRPVHLTHSRFILPSERERERGRRSAPSGRELSNPLSVSSAKRIDHIFPKRVPISVSFLQHCRYFKASFSYSCLKFSCVHAIRHALFIWNQTKDDDITNLKRNNAWVDTKGEKNPASLDTVTMIYIIIYGHVLVHILCSGWVWRHLLRSSTL